MLRTRHWGSALLVLGALTSAACTRSASSAAAGSVGTGTPAPLTGQQATMEAVRSALLTQTAQAGAALATLPPAATTVPTQVVVAATQTSPAPATSAVTTPTATTASAGCPYPYIVQPGDRLFRIAIDLGYDPDFWVEIAAANNIPDPYLVYPGQEITIPCP